MIPTASDEIEISPEEEKMPSEAADLSQPGSANINIHAKIYFVFCHSIFFAEHYPNKKDEITFQFNRLPFPFLKFNSCTIIENKFVKPLYKCPCLF